MNFNGGFNFNNDDRTIVHTVPYPQTQPGFAQYVRSLDQAYVDSRLSDEVIRNSDYFDYKSNVLLTNARNFRNGDATTRLNYLGILLNDLPTEDFRLYVPTPDNLDTMFANISLKDTDFENARLKSSKFADLMAQLEFWASRFTFPEEEVNSGRHIGHPYFMSRILVLPQFVLELLAMAKLPPELYDKVSKTEIGLTFALLTGKIIESTYDPTTDREKWKIISTLDISQVSGIVRSYTDLEDHIPNLFNPLVYGVLLFISDSRIIELVPYFQLELLFKTPGRNYVLSEGAQRLRNQYITKENFYQAIGLNPIYYLPNPSIKVEDVAGYILHKILGIPRPALVYSIPTFDRRDEAAEILMWYNDDEIMSFYFPYFLSRKARKLRVVGLTSRLYILNLILSKYLEANFNWIFRREKTAECSNGENVNIMYGGRRDEDIAESSTEELNENPVIWYGADLDVAKHRCFRVAELLEVFRNTLDDPTGPDFPDPDYITPGPGRPHIMDPLTGRRLLRTFSFEQISKLRLQLTTQIGAHGRNYNGQLSLVAQLDEVINRIFPIRFAEELRNQVAGNISNLREMIEAVGAHPEWKNDILIFSGWLFMFSMWMRFWKGPGYPFNIDRVTLSTNKCPHIQRDEHIIIELSVYGNMITDLENRNKDLANFIKNLPLFRYEWETKRVESGGTRISTAIDAIQNEKYCMGYAGDVLLQTAYVYLILIMNIPVDRMNDFMTYVVKLLSGRERAVIETRKRILEGTRATERSHQTWVQQGLETVRAHELLLQIGTPGHDLPHIDLTTVGYNMHV